MLYIMRKKALKYLHYKLQTIAFYNQNSWKNENKEKQKLNVNC